MKQIFGQFTQNILVQVRELFCTEVGRIIRDYYFLTQANHRAESRSCSVGGLETTPSFIRRNHLPHMSNLQNEFSLWALVLWYSVCLWAANKHTEVIIFQLLSSLILLSCRHDVYRDMVMQEHTQRLRSCTFFSSISILLKSTMLACQSC